MKYDVPDNYEFAREYINSVAVAGHVPSDTLIDEVSMLEQFLISDFAKSHVCFRLLSCFPSLFIEKVLPMLKSKIQLSEVDFEEPKAGQSDSIILCTEQRALASFSDKNFNEYIKYNKNQILFLRRWPDIGDSVIKMSGTYINGMDYNAWKSDCTSHLHMGLKTHREDQYVVENW